MVDTFDQQVKTIIYHRLTHGGKPCCQSDIDKENEDTTSTDDTIGRIIAELQSRRHKVMGAKAQLTRYQECTLDWCLSNVAMELFAQYAQMGRMSDLELPDLSLSQSTFERQIAEIVRFRRKHHGRIPCHSRQDEAESPLGKIKVKLNLRRHKATGRFPSECKLSDKQCSILKWVLSDEVMRVHRVQGDRANLASVDEPVGMLE